jgi:hypothetical protein
MKISLELTVVLLHILLWLFYLLLKWNNEEEIVVWFGESFQEEIARN